MGTYLCYYLNRDGSIPMFDSVEAESPDEALRIGELLLRRAPERAGLEVWSGERRISTLMKGDLSA